MMARSNQVCWLTTIHLVAAKEQTDIFYKCVSNTTKLTWLTIRWDGEYKSLFTAEITSSIKLFFLLSILRVAFNPSLTECRVEEVIREAEEYVMFGHSCWLNMVSY